MEESLRAPVEPEMVGVFDAGKRRIKSRIPLLKTRRQPSNWSKPIARRSCVKTRDSPSDEEESRRHLDKIKSDEDSVKVSVSENCSQNPIGLTIMNSPENYSNTLNNNTIDFIEMLTLDAKEFLKCVCSARQHFCKDCFGKSKELNHSLENNNNIPNGSQNEIVGTLTNENNVLVLNNSCEPPRLDNRLPNDGNNSDERSENILIGMMENFNIDSEDLNEKILDQKNVSNVLTSDKTGHRKTLECNIASDSTEVSDSDNNDDIFCSSLQHIKKDNDNDMLLNSLDLIASQAKGCNVPSTFAENNLDPKNKSQRPDKHIASKGRESDAEIISATENDLDPKSAFQHLVNPASRFPNSSETFPSSGHRQQSSYGESCASRESIGTDERSREQAPLRSRESTADVVVSDAFGRRVSQDLNLGAVSKSLTESESDICRFRSNFDASASSLENDRDDNSEEHRQELTWGFENGRLVFTESKSNLEELRLPRKQVVCVAESKTQSGDSKDELEPPVSRIINRSTDGTAISSNKGLLSSKEINKRSDDSNSRLKYLENKLKRAGLTDAKDDVNAPNQTGDAQNNNNSIDCLLPTTSSCTCTDSSSGFAQAHQYNSNDCLEKPDTVENSSAFKFIDYSEFSIKDTHKEELLQKENIVEGEDLIPDGSHDFCQFDVNDFAGFSALSAGIYDEYLEESSSDETCECDEEEHFIVIRRMRGDGLAMVNDSSERNKHNPDRDNLKSLLKKPGRAKDRKSNRVVFNENKNEFFDADYIILIREDCDLDDDDDDGICTCQQHEMVRLTCCEPNCNCQYEGGVEQTPQSPKFAPPLEFVDAVTLSPPEGYKDMELMAATRGQQRGAVCKECSATHEEELEDEGEASQSDSEMDGHVREQEEKEKTDQSQQTTPTTPPSSENSSNQNYILETLTTTKVTQQQILREAEEVKRPPPPPSQGSPISGILKGGRLWKQQGGIDIAFAKNGDSSLLSSDSVTSDDESNNRRSVRFIESEEKEKRDSCDGAPESSPEEEIPVQKEQNLDDSQLVPPSKLDTYGGNSPDTPEMTLTFKLGNHVLISNNSLKPNSAVRQLFPCTKSLAAAQGVPEEENSQQYLVTAESLRAFEEAKRSKLPQIIQSGETDETIKRAIERNTLRRSLIRYEPRSRKQPYKSDNSLVERIKQLTCDVEDAAGNNDPSQQQSSVESSEPPEDVLDSRSSPPGEESRNSPDVNTLSAAKTPDKSFSPSSSSTASSNSSISINQNYHQMRKLSGAGEHALIVPDIQNNFRRDIKPLPDIGGPHNHELPVEPPRAVANPPDLSHCVVSNKMSSSSNTSESRRQFLSTLAPLTACVTMGVAHNEDYYYHLSNNSSHTQPGDRVSVASSGTEYSLEDIDEGLKTEDEEHKRIAPDVLAGTPSASESGDELAIFVQQDAGRIERIKKKYQPAEQPKDNKNDEDDEHDDYGFNRRPSVRGIKPRFSTTTEILQQIQNQLQPPAPPSARVAWPYYSETGLTDNSKQKNANQNVTSGNYQYVTVADEAKPRAYPPQYRPTSLQEESMYQNCANQRCVSRDIYQRPNANVYSSVIRMGNDYYQSLPLARQRNGRPQSPPPMDMSKQYNQTMVYIPYNHIEGYQPVQYYHTGTSDYVTRVSSQNQINKRYIEPVYQSRVHHHVDDHHYNSTMIPPVPPKALNRAPYPNGQPPPHMMSGSRSESPLPGQFSTARSTQTPAPAMATCGYYPSNARYRPVMGSAWQGEGNYVTKVNRHSFPIVGPRYPPADSISLTDSDSQHSGSLPNGYRQSDISLYASKDSMPNSPTKPRFIERGVPEGAASVSPQDISGVSQSSSSTMTSPTSPQNPSVPTNQKAMFYAMNV